MASYENSLTANDVAAILQIGRNAVYDLAKSGELRSYKMGRKLLFTLDDVNAYFARKSGTAAPAAQPTFASDLEGALAPLVQQIDAIKIAGEGQACASLVGLLQETGLAVSPVQICDYAALASLYTNQADAAVVCLYDQKANRCNIPQVQCLVPGTSLMVIRLFEQPIGLIVAQGNPLRLSTWGSLFRHGTRLINRPRGTRERVLLDAKVITFELVTKNIEGYDHEAKSTIDAASLVAQGIGDACIGTAQVARMVPGTQFIPLQNVTTDLVVLKNDRTRSFLRSAKRTLATPAFQKQFGGAEDRDTSNMGSIVYEC